jgi:hypothetical protein
MRSRNCSSFVEVSGILEQPNPNNIIKRNNLRGRLVDLQGQMNRITLKAQQSWQAKFVGPASAMLSMTWLP